MPILQRNENEFSLERIDAQAAVAGGGGVGPRDLADGVDLSWRDGGLQRRVIGGAVPDRCSLGGGADAEVRVVRGAEWRRCGAER